MVLTAVNTVHCLFFLYILLIVINGNKKTFKNQLTLNLGELCTRERGGVEGDESSETRHHRYLFISSFFLSFPQSLPPPTSISKNNFLYFIVQIFM